MLSIGRSQVIGPFTDEMGRWVSADAPVKDSANRRVIAAVVQDIDAGTWSQDIARQRLAAIVSTALLQIIVISFWWWQKSLRSALRRLATRGG